MAERAEIVLSATDKTRAAFKSAQANLTSFKNSVSSGAALATGALGALGVSVVGVAALLDKLNPKSVIDYADSLDDLSQRSGIAVESLSVLGYQAKVEGISIDELGNALKKLNLNIAEAAKGGSEQAAAFKAIGVSVVDLNGRVRSADEVLADVAERFSGYSDGARKVALANAIGGKSFESLIPLLNGGRAGLQAARKELEAFGGILGTELAEKSGKFNDNLVKLSVATDAAKVAIAGPLVQALSDYSSKLVEAARNQELLKVALIDFAKYASPQAFISRFLYDKIFDSTKMQETQRDVDGLTLRIKLLQDQLERTPNSAPIIKEIGRLQGQLVLTQDRAKIAEQAAADAPREVRSLAARFPAPAKPEAPVVPRAGLAGAPAGINAAEVLRRKVLDNEIKKIEISLENERDLFQNQNRRLADAFSDGELSIDNYFSRRTESQDAYLERVRAGYDAEIKLLQDAQAKIAADKPQDRAEIQGRIEEVYAKQARAVREAAQATEEAERDRVRATGDFRAALRDLDAQIAELSGDTYAADLLRNAETLAQARGVLARAGGDPEREAQLAGLLRLQAEVNKSRQDYSLIVERAQLAEEAFLIQAERGGFTRQQVEQGVAALREDSLRQLDELIASTESLAAATKDPSVLAYFDSLKLARARAFDAKDPGLQRFNDLAREAGSSIASVFADAARNGGKLSDVLGNIGKKLLDISTRELVEKPFEDAITGLIKQGGKAAQTGGSGAGLFDGVLKAFGIGGGSAAADGKVPKATEAATDALAGLAGEGSAVSSVLAALPNAATVPMVAAFTALTAAATSAAAALQALAFSGGGGAGGGLATSIFGNGLGIENIFGGGFGTGAQFGFQDLGLFLHGGGVAGVAGGTLRNVSPLAWAGAERYHTGGMAGLAPDEVPAILRRGEEVLTQADPRHRYRMGDAYDTSRGQPINQTINVPASTTRETANQMASKLWQRASFAARRNG